MNNKKIAFFKVILSLCLVLAFMGCATTNVASNEFTIYETTERMFWAIEGTSKKGETSLVYILGTIHAGDERLYPLSEPVLGSLAVADRVVGELSSSDIERADSEIQRILVRGINYNENVFDYFDERQINYLEKNFDKEILEGLAVLDPWIISILVLEMAMSETNLSAEYGIDTNIYAFAREEGIKVEGLDSLKTQMDVISLADFTFDEQIEIVKEIIDESIEEDQAKALNDLYRAYLNNDKDTLAEISNDPKGGSELEERYNKVIFEDRNKSWANKIVGYLNEGGVTFIFAGAGHFHGENSVFDYLLEG